MIFLVIILPIIAFLSMFLFYHLDWTTKNYEGDRIPYSLGVYIIFSYFLFQYLYIEQAVFLALILYLSGIWAVGLVDDRFGSLEQKGLRGHIKAFITEGKLSTGILKITSTVVLSFYFILYLQPLTTVEWIRYGIILVLTPHIFNLFDTRPLRVWKVSLLYGSLFLLLLQYMPFSAYLYLVTFFFVFYVFEGHKIAMLGDNGATLIGGIFAVITIMQASISQQWTLIGLFFLLTILAEKTSFSRVIEKSNVLKWLDRLGIASSK